MGGVAGALLKLEVCGRQAVYCNSSKAANFAEWWRRGAADKRHLILQVGGGCVADKRYSGDVALPFSAGGSLRPRLLWARARSREGW